MMTNNAHTSLRHLVTWICLLLALTGMKAQTEGVKLKHLPKRSELVPSGYGYDIQKTSTLRQTVYAIPGGAFRKLKLPPYRSGSASPTNVYTRWYDYKTDEWASHLKVASSGTRKFISGHFFINNANIDVQEAQVSLPAGEEEYVVACDVSSYNDYVMDGNLFISEPTLSYRTIFEVRDANQIASRLKELNAKNEFLENVEIHIPNVASGKENPRVMLNFDVDNYFCYAGDDETVLLNGSQAGNSFVSELTVNGVKRRVTRKLQTVEVIKSGGDNVGWSRNGRFIFITPMVSDGPKVLEFQLRCQCYTKTDEYRNGQWVEASTEVESFAYNLARYTVYFEPSLLRHYSMDATDYRSLSYLDNNYVLLAKQDFDTDTEPATETNNCGMTPIELDDCTYGFVYPISERKLQTGNKVAQWNEYGFYKTAEVAGVSKSGMNKWQWYNNGNPVYDRAYYDSGTRKNGYFMYIDASDMPGTVAKLRFDDPLCAGTKLIVSAGVCSLTKGDVSDGDVTFIFKGVDADGNETELHRCTSGDIPKVKNESGAYGGENGNEWYQVYYSFSYSSEVEYKSYLLQVDNSAANTAGGDYAIDDIRVYRSKPAVRAAQESLPCDVNEKPSVRVRIGFDKLVESLSEKENSGKNIVLRYQFLDSKKAPLEGYDYETGQNYGVISFNTTFSDMGTDIPEATGDDKILAGTETLEVTGELTRFIAFRVPNSATLKYGESYYVVIANRDGVFETGTCALISDLFRILPPSEITVDGEGVADARGMCYGTPVELSARIYDRINLTPVDCGFDWYMGDDFATYSAALQHYRTVYSNPRADEHELKKSSGVFTETDYALLKTVVDKKQLRLNYTTIVRRVTRGETILAIPIEGTIVGTDVTICPDAIRLNTDVEADIPTLSLGLTEPAALRMSLEQFEDLRKGNILKLRVFDFSDADGTQKHPLVKIDGNTSVMLYATSDVHYIVDAGIPEYWAADLKGMEVKQNGDNYVLLDFSSSTETGQLSVREGYTYWLSFDFQEQVSEGEASVCNGVAKFAIRIVPKYLTWTGQEGDNWNNDNNWKRSTKSDIYKEDYEDESDNPGFVPLNFSLATIANTPQAPWLYRLIKDSEGLENIAQSGNHNDGSNLPTDMIELEQVMVKRSGIGYIYSAAPFYGNTCSEIYFKPGAEMRNTEHLEYNQAWIDFELTAGRWYMLSSPLQEVVAGDMYLPAQTGRQETEAFKDILYDKECNNRFSPAVYQRSWDKSGSTVIYSGGLPSTDAFISADWSRVYNKVDEAYPVGHCFSIRPVASVSDRVLFRLPKADHQYLYYSFDNVVEGNATPVSRNAAKVGRLVTPDADGKVIVKATNTTDDNHLFLFGNPFMATLDMAAFFKANPQLEPKFWMITESGQASTIFDEEGNAVSTDATAGTTLAPMQGFFVEVKNSAVTRSIESPEVVFTTDMTVAKPVSGLLRTETRSAEHEMMAENILRIKAERNGQGNTILIKHQEGADNDYRADEDVAALMDSNLEEWPTLYSVAGNRAVSINVLNNRKMIPLGVYSKDETEVKLTFRGLETFSSDVELYDAELNTYTVLDEETEVYIAGNTHGRYFIIPHAASDTNDADTEATISIYSPQPQHLVVASVPADPLQQIQVYSVGGVLLKSIDASGAVSKEVNLPGGTYVVKVQSRYNRAVEKVVVK